MASVDGSMWDLSFDMTDVFGSTGRDSDFGTDSPADMELCFDPTDVHDGSTDTT